jgi:hypothetical protein
MWNERDALVWRKGGEHHREGLVNLRIIFLHTILAWPPKDVFEVQTYEGISTNPYVI